MDRFTSTAIYTSEFALEIMGLHGIEYRRPSSYVGVLKGIKEANACIDNCRCCTWSQHKISVQFEFSII